jgi:hypothetical protein
LYNRDIFAASDVLEQRRLTFNEDEREDRGNKKNSGLLSGEEEILCGIALRRRLNLSHDQRCESDLIKRARFLGIVGVPWIHCRVCGRLITG